MIGWWIDPSVFQVSNVVIAAIVLVLGSKRVKPRRSEYDSTVHVMATHQVKTIT